MRERDGNYMTERDIKERERKRTIPRFLDFAIVPFIEIGKIVWRNGYKNQGFCFELCKLEMSGATSYGSTR
jgi:hypothetical protein